jgi:hydroxylaminobenzene mutase
MDVEKLRHEVAARGAVLFGLGMTTGLWAGAALTEKVKVAIPHLALAAHLNGIFGGLWLFALAFTLPLLSYGEVGVRRLVTLTLVPTYGNWAVTLLASVLGVRGLEFTGNGANDVVAALLLALVVAPTLAACAGWVWGFRRRAA